MEGRHGLYHQHGRIATESWVSHFPSVGLCSSIYKVVSETRSRTAAFTLGSLGILLTSIRGGPPVSETLGPSSGDVLVEKQQVPPIKDLTSWCVCVCVCVYTETNK